jgi:hypothetical protein
MPTSLYQRLSLWLRTLSHVTKIQFFSIPIIVTTSIIYYGISDFLTGSLWFIGHQIRWQLWFLIHRLHLKVTKKRWQRGWSPGPHWGSPQRSPRTPVVVYYRALSQTPLGGLTALLQTPCRQVSIKHRQHTQPAPHPSYRLRLHRCEWDIPWMIEHRLLGDNETRTVYRNIH